ncbi:hypothetical protein BZA70DRAFT_274222 [Myxozyma melibiosi]|uniref:Uncharacterized protein n=1 Tax=Myxozyma melibiosi TaxID=54550 RepID=A0ABR1FFP4_9ASCO
MAKVLSSIRPFSKSLSSEDSQAILPSPRLGRTRSRSYSKVPSNYSYDDDPLEDSSYDPSSTPRIFASADSYSTTTSSSLSSLAKSNSPPRYVYKPPRGPSTSPSRPAPLSRPRFHSSSSASSFHGRSKSTGNPFLDSAPLSEDAEDTDNPFLTRREKRAHTVSGSQPDLSFLSSSAEYGEQEHEQEQPPQLAPKPRTRPRAKTLSGISSPLRSPESEIWVNYRNEDPSAAPVPVFADYSGRSPRNDMSANLQPPPLLRPKPDLRRWKAEH